MLRIFMGLELDEDTRADLARELAYLRNTAPRVRWVAPENLHLTLKFVGEIPEAELPPVLEAATEAAAQAQAFTLGVTGLGMLPDLHRPRVVYARCEEGAEAVAALAKRVEEACAVLGYKPEKRAFRPHITLGRVKSPRDAEGLAEVIEDAASQVFGLLDVCEVAVFMSELKRSGAEYTVMHRAALCE